MEGNVGRTRTTGNYGNRGNAGMSDIGELEFAPSYRKKTRVTQRVIVPDGQDRVTAPPMSRTGFERLRAEARIDIGGGWYVTRAQCFWDERHETISVMPGLGRLLGPRER